MIGLAYLLPLSLLEAGNVAEVPKLVEGISIADLSEGACTEFFREGHKGHGKSQAPMRIRKEDKGGLLERYNDC